MAEIQKRNRGVRKDKRKRGEGQIGGCSPGIRLASIKLPRVSGAHINGPGAEYGQIDYTEKSYPFLLSGGYLQPVDEVTDPDAFIATLMAAHDRMCDGFDEVGYVTIAYGGEQDAFLGYRHMAVDENCWYLVLDDLAGHPEEIKRVCLGCLHLIERMGFGTIEQTGWYDMFLESDWGDEFEDEDSEETRQDRADYKAVQEHYRKHSINDQIVADDELVRRYATHQTPLGEWCRLCLEYGTNPDFDICDFQASRIENHDPTVHITESHIIMQNLDDSLWHYYSAEIDCSFGNGGCLPVCDYALYTAEECIKQPEGVDRPKVSKDINRIWAFDLLKQTFYNGDDKTG